MKDFITGAELLKRWKCEDWQLLQIIKANSKENRLQPHDKATLSEIEIDPSIKYYVSGHLGHHGQRQYTSAEILPILHDCLFRLAHVALIETEKSESEENEHPETHEPARRSDYLFRKTGDFWQIRFKGVDIGPIRHVDGLSYLAQYLTSPGVNIPDRSFFQGNGDAMSESAAIQNGLHTDHRPQEISTPEAMKQYAAEYHKLQQEYDDAESDLERAEIEKEMNQILPHLKNRNFTNPDDKKCQANISRRIKTALGKLPADFAQYLKDTITTDNYGRIYRGAERWE